MQCLNYGLIHEWISAINRNQDVGSIFVDLPKAFDIVNHAILLNKLSDYHLDDSTVLWINLSHTFLKRSFVQDEGVSSNVLLVITGVPHGSVLGPLLFLICIKNDLLTFVRSAIVDLFADDTTLSKSSLLLAIVIESFKIDIENINDWCKSSLMYINASKSKVMILSSKIKVKAIRERAKSFQLHDEAFSFSNEEKLLLITINSSFNFIDLVY